MPPTANPDAKRAEKVKILFSFLLVLSHIKDALNYYTLIFFSSGQI
tara:strand:- start:580 stop:717 length:138 start_codon:yes stop_codon:yes gene_type:complete